MIFLTSGSPCPTHDSTAPLGHHEYGLEFLSGATPSSPPSRCPPCHPQAVTAKVLLASYPPEASFQVAPLHVCSVFVSLCEPSTEPHLTIFMLKSSSSLLLFLPLPDPLRPWCLHVCLHFFHHPECPCGPHSAHLCESAVTSHSYPPGPIHSFSRSPRVGVSHGANEERLKQGRVGEKVKIDFEMTVIDHSCARSQSIDE